MNAVDSKLARGFKALEALGLHALPLEREGDHQPRRSETAAHGRLCEFVWWLDRAQITHEERAALEAQWKLQGVAASLGNSAITHMAKWLAENRAHLSAQPWTAKGVKRLLKSADRKLRRAL